MGCSRSEVFAEILRDLSILIHRCMWVRLNETESGAEGAPVELHESLLEPFKLACIDYVVTSLSTSEYDLCAYGLTVGPLLHVLHEL